MKKINGIFLPFDLFGNDGTQLGCHLLYKAFENETYLERKFYNLNTMFRLKKWRKDITKMINTIFCNSLKNKLALFGGNHIATFPLYCEIQKQYKYEGQTWTIVRFDAHTDVQSESKHLNIGNFMRYFYKDLPIIHLGGLKENNIYQYEITANDLNEGNNRNLNYFLTGNLLYIDFDVDVLSLDYFRSYLSHHEGGLSLKVCISLINEIINCKPWKKIIWSLTEFCGLTDSSQSDIKVILQLTRCALNIK